MLSPALVSQWYRPFLVSQSPKSDIIAPNPINLNQSISCIDLLTTFSYNLYLKGATELETEIRNIEKHSRFILCM